MTDSILIAARTTTSTGTPGATISDASASASVKVALLLGCAPPPPPPRRDEELPPGAVDLDAPPLWRPDEGVAAEKEGTRWLLEMALPGVPEPLLWPLLRGRRPRGRPRPLFGMFLLRAEAPKGTPAGRAATPGIACAVPLVVVLLLLPRPLPAWLLPAPFEDDPAEEAGPLFLFRTLYAEPLLLTTPCPAPLLPPVLPLLTLLVPPTPTPLPAPLPTLLRGEDPENELLTEPISPSV